MAPGPRHGVADKVAGDKLATPVNNSFYDTLGDRWLSAQDDPVALLRAEGVIKQAWVLRVLRDRMESRSESTTSTASPLAFPLKILDVGCGAGFLARGLRSEGHEVHALDYSLESLRVSQRENARLTYLRGDALRLPYRDSSFDVVTSMDFLEHIEDPSTSVREAARVLRPGGLFFFHTFNRNPLAWLIIIKGLEWFVRNTPEHMHVLHLFIKPRELVGFCRDAGLEPFEWTGVRPDFTRRAFWRMLRTGVVPEDFRFVLTRSLMLSYLGAARKTER
jgi:2-polyprenyl-6-hydroxyphenyl methylase/3-demethylubiquinone-9 3-methyltransferase